MPRRALAALLLLLAVLLPSCSAEKSVAIPTSSAAPSPTDDAASPWSLLVIGDSYAAGEGADSPDTSFAWQLGRDLGTPTSVDAVGGTGFINPGPNGVDQRYATRLSTLSVDQLASTVIVVEGGLNDRSAPAVDIRAAAQDFLARLREIAPAATVVLMGATAPVPSAPADSAAVNSALAEAGAEYDVTFVDPIGPDWFTADNVGAYVTADQLHPTQAGHDFLARRLADVVETALRD